METLSNESALGASFNKFSLLQGTSGTDADQSLEVLESLDCDVSKDAENEADAEPDENARRAEISKSNLRLALPDNREISSLKIEELKAKLDKRGLKKSGNKCTLVQRRREAIVNRFSGSQAIKTNSNHKSKALSMARHTPNVDDIYSFIEIRVKEVYRLEIEKLKLEASASNEIITSLREENNLLNERIQELESRYESQ